MAVQFSDNASISLLTIFLLSISLRISSANVEKASGFCTDQNPTRPEVTIPQGTVRGVTLSTRNNRPIAGFLGIPYAEPPIGNLRFKAPVSASAWNGILDAGSDTLDCPQLSTDNEITGDEDCLYTNVYTPQLPMNRDSKPLPVMMYIYGGGNIEGSNNSTLYGPGYLLDKDVVLVVPSYRLGALGFLSTGDAESPGNWGLKDLVLALEWIRDNIEFFGGDPNQVTILGNSAGSMSVNFLALSDSTTGLFHKYITQSGSGLSPLGYQPNVSSIDYAFRLGEYVGCPTNTSTLLVECLRTLNFTEILSIASEFIVWGAYPRVTWGPTAEPDLEGAVLTDDPANLVAAGKLRDIPSMVGSVREDGFVLTGYFYAYPAKFDEFLENFDYLLPYVLNYYNRADNVSAYTSALKSYYFNNDLTTNKTVLLSNLTQLCSDFISNFPNHEELKVASVIDSSYLYSFEYRGTYSYSYVWGYGSTEYDVVSHSDELIYLFPESGELFGKANETMSESDFEMVDTMVDLWTSFAITGKPESTALASNELTEYSTEMEYYVRLGNGTDASSIVELESSAFDDRMQFLESVNGSFIYIKN